MDDNNRRRRQNDAPMYAPANSRFSQDQSQARGFPASSAERFRPSLLATSPASGRSTGGGVGGSGSASAGYGYYNEAAAPYAHQPLPTQNPMQYQTGYSDANRPASNFSGYNTNVMYNLPAEATQSNVYEPQQFPSRQPASMQTLPDTIPYFPGEPTNPSGASALQHHASPNSSGVYQQNPADRNNLLQGYSAGMNMGGLSQQGTAAPEVIEEQNYQQPDVDVDDAYARYQSQLKVTFQNIKNGVLVEASQLLLEVSNWLLSHVGDLGLTVDNEALHSDRIKLWNEFNNAWLALYQKQKDMLLNVIESGHSPRSPQSLISYDYIKRMGTDLVHLCDGIEKYGLVDYQYGVWEDSITNIMTECLDLLEEIEERGDGAGRAPP